MWLRLWKIRQRRFRRSPEMARLRHFFGDRIFHASFWHVSRESLSRGLSLGLFVAFTPTIPFHMVLAAIGAIFIGRVNLPVALAACWVTNPLTIYPIYRSAEKLGNYLILHAVVIDDFLKFMFGATPSAFIIRPIRISLGLLVYALLAALAGNLFMRALWDFTHYRLGKKPPRKRLARPKPSPEETPNTES